MKSIINFCFVMLIFVCTTFGQAIKLTPLTTGLNKPVDISNTGIPGDQRLYIVEKDGKIKITQGGTVLSPVFLDIDALVNSAANERGLLGLVFHPKFSENKYFYVHYNNLQGHTVIARYKATANQLGVEPNSAKIILTVNQPYNNHNGGDLNFGPDGYLYIALGDGGSGGDPGNRSQNPKDMLGKVLRIDVDTENAPYIIPTSNPFVGSTDTLPEIWSIGWRNPWRFSFDKSTGEMWLADVGQDVWEEISVEAANTPGLNYGWRCYEGNANFNTFGCGNKSNYAAPVHVYPNRFDVGCSVTGGYVYRGNKIPELVGSYIYADFCTGKFWRLVKNNAGTYDNFEIGDFDAEDFSSFGEDIDGELYVSGLASGTIYKIELKPSSIDYTQNKPSISIIENPASNTLKLALNNLSKANYSIMQINGAGIFSGSITNDQSNIDISSLSQGTYLLYVESEGIMITRKFVKI